MHFVGKKLIFVQNKMHHDKDEDSRVAGFHDEDRDIQSEGCRKGA